MLSIVNICDIYTFEIVEYQNTYTKFKYFDIKSLYI